MTNPGGIAGAMDYVPTAGGKPALACVACGKEIDAGTRGNFHARSAAGVGIIHACSDDCAADPRFAPVDIDALRSALAAAEGSAIKAWGALCESAKTATALATENERLRAAILPVIFRRGPRGGRLPLRSDIDALEAALTPPEQGQ